MKTISTLLLATIFSSSAFAWGEGRIGITVAGGNNVQVLVDGRAYQSNDNTIMLSNLQPGNHSIRIVKNNGNSRSRNDRNNTNVLYSSNIYLKPNYYVDIMVNRFGRALVDERQLDDRSQGDWDRDGNWGNNGGYNDGSSAGMNDYQFNQLLERVRSQYGNSQRYTAARDGINSGTFRVAQISSLLGLFSSEPDKLELAKLSYNRVVDRQNFSQLYDQFSYRGRTDLENYVRNGR